MYLFGVIFVNLIAGCSGLTLEKGVVVAQGDWVMAGGSPDQTNVSSYELAPPLNLLWDYNLEGGVGSAGIAVSDAVVFVNVLQGEMFTFDISTGGKLGNIKFLGKDASTTPLVLGNDVIVSFAGDKKYSLISYNMLAGKINWRKYYGDIQTSPVLSGGAVYFGSLSGVQYKTDVSNGKRFWKFRTGSPIHSTCALSDSNLVFGCDNGKIYSLNSETGQKRWEVKTPAPVNSTALLHNETCFIGGDDSVYYAIRLDSGNVNWKINLHSKITAGSALYNDNSVITGCVDGSIYSLNITDGTINWVYRSKGAVLSSPVVSGNFVYCSSYDSYIYALNASNGEYVWSSMLENKVRTSPVIWRDYLFVAADEMFYCFTSKTIEIKK
jgi:outer membrane protein assembly factor BamB